MGEECEGEKVESCSLGIWRQKGGGARGGFWLFCCARQRNFHMLIISDHLATEKGNRFSGIEFRASHPSPPPWGQSSLYCPTKAER